MTRYDKGSAASFIRASIDCRTHLRRVRGADSLCQLCTQRLEDWDKLICKGKATVKLKYGKVYGKVSQCSELKRILFDILPTPINFRHLERVRKSASGPEISWSSKQPEITDGFSKQPFVKGIFTTHKTPVSACFAFQVGICCFLLRLACCILFGAFLASRHCVELQQLHWIGGDTERCGFASLGQCQCSPGCNRSLDQHESAGSMESTERWRLG